MNRDIDELLAALTLEEKARLTAGEDMFSTPAVERLGIPKVRLTDGPSGARGLAFPGFGGDPSSCIPCGSAVGATWDPSAAEALGELLGREALDRGCRGLLAPTVNLHRSPLAGRNFECYSEDPLLSGKLAAAFIRGVQSTGVFATVKHFVGNEAEHERNSISSVIDDRALRELYLLPFELAVKEGGADAVMTAYNRLNGRWLTERPELLSDLLRGEWGFGGLVMTDWFAVADRTTSLAAGLDLEMPGPGRALGEPLVEAVRDGTITEADLDAALRRLLGTYERIGILGQPTPPVTAAPTTAKDAALIRRVAADATVLLHNDGILPIDGPAIRRIAVLGPNAVTPCIVGGGSAGLLPGRLPNVVDALTAALGSSVEVVHERGCEISVAPTLVGRAVLRAADGFEVELHDGPDLEGEPVERRHLDELRLMVLSGFGDTRPAGTEWSCRVRGVVVPDEGGRFDLALAQAGRARVLLDGRVVLDGVANPPPPGGTDFFGMGSQDLVTVVQLSVGVPVDLVVEFVPDGGGLAGFRVGFRTDDADGLLDRAVAAAASADVAVVVVGTNEGWETEGRDRTTLELPGRQDELVRRVAVASPSTVVVVNAGAPVELSWVDDVAAVVQCWFGGQELDHALADILTGVAEPGGRLPMSLPRRVEHNPAHENFPGENGELRYGEGLFMGYRGYDHRRIEPRFAFGHGLGYTTFDLGTPALSQPAHARGATTTIVVPVTNTGRRPGAAVVQCYVAPEAPRLSRPPKELKAFAKVHVDPGETTTVQLVLDDRAFAYWDPGQADWEALSQRSASLFGAPAAERRAAGWQVDPGRYQLLIGWSSADIVVRVDLEVVP